MTQKFWVSVDLGARRFHNCNLFEGPIFLLACSVNFVRRRFWAISTESQTSCPNRRRTKCTKHARQKIRPSKRLELHSGTAQTQPLPKKFCIWCHTKTAFDDTSDEKSVWFLCVPLCRRGIWCVIRGNPKNGKWGPARWTQKWSWSWLGRPLFSHFPEIRIPIACYNRVHAKGVVLCERACFCLLSTF